ncbi:hypothetical protein [Enterovirga rhinocerotis]|uniref:Uncharacterized protein n=1 Tax=Enterovirga rhinocerotis TaxID=1339210 RepID=A0A4R7C8Z8_9HYPH|nr:hypothetical protein [Enterovirga rhinocerotis]TDR93795.1 hypothetical protein EV668_1062 [Enterovirga rhinocerotis]
MAARSDHSRRQRAVGPNDIDHVEVWGGIAKEQRIPVYGVEYVLGDGSRICMSLRPDLAEAMLDARELADGRRYPIVEGSP